MKENGPFQFDKKHENNEEINLMKKKKTILEINHILNFANNTYENGVSTIQTQKSKLQNVDKNIQ